MNCNSFSLVLIQPSETRNGGNLRFVWRYYCNEPTVSFDKHFRTDNSIIPDTSPGTTRIVCHEVNSLFVRAEHDSRYPPDCRRESSSQTCTFARLKRNKNTIISSVNVLFKEHRQEKNYTTRHDCFAAKIPRDIFFYSPCV